MGVPQNGRFIMEHPIKMNDLGVPLVQETSMCANGFFTPTVNGVISSQHGGGTGNVVGGE